MVMLYVSSSSVVVSNVVFQWPIAVVPVPSVAYSQVVSLVGLISLNVVLNMVVVLSFVDAFICMVPFCMVLFVGVIIDAFGSVLSMVMEMFVEVFTLPPMSVAFALRL